MSFSSDYDPATDFSGFATYDWLPELQSPTGDPRADDRLLHVRIRRAVERELEVKGYKKPLVDKPDFLIGYHVALDEKTTVVLLDKYYGYAFHDWGWSREGSYHRPYNRVGPAEPYEYAYEQGTLILDIARPGPPRELIWRGSAKAELSSSDNGQKSSQTRIDKAVNGILAQFPPTPPE